MYLKDFLQVQVKSKRNCKRARVFSMTKAEETVYKILISEQHAIIAQQVRNLFQLDGGGMYIPDFLVIDADSMIRVIEVKGGYRGAGFEQGYERYKRAAAQFSNKRIFSFELWEVTKDGITRQFWDA